MFSFALALLLNCRVKVNSHIFEVIGGPRIVNIFNTVYDGATSNTNNVLVTIWMWSYEAGGKTFNNESKIRMIREEGVRQCEITLV